jgi:hypothetical protein
MRVVSISEVRGVRSRMFQELEMRDVVDLNVLNFRSIGWVIERLQETSDARVVSSSGMLVIHLSEYERVLVGYDVTIVEIVDYAILIVDDAFLLLEYNCRKWGYIPLARGWKLSWDTKLLTPSDVHNIAKGALQRILGRTVVVPYCL